MATNDSTPPHAADLSAENDEADQHERSASDLVDRLAMCEDIDFEIDEIGIDLKAAAIADADEFHPGMSSR